MSTTETGLTWGQAEYEAVQHGHTLRRPGWPIGAYIQHIPAAQNLAVHPVTGGVEKNGQSDLVPSRPLVHIFRYWPPGATKPGSFYYPSDEDRNATDWTTIAGP